MLEENIEREEKLWLKNKDEERKEVRKEESRSEEKSRRERIEIRWKACVKERKKVKAKMTHRPGGENKGKGKKMLLKIKLN